MKRLPAITFLALLAASSLPLAAAAAITQWTSTAAGCTVAPNGPGTMNVGGGVTYDNISTSLVSIQLVCNVAPTANSNAPDYASLTVGYSNVTTRDEIQAEVLEIDPGSGKRVSSSCVAANPATPTSGTATCRLEPFTFNFSKYFYEVVITISRTADTESPQANGVSLH
jgi:hypothetical protein